MENKEVLYNFYDKILNCLIINTKSMTKHNKRRGYYIPHFNMKDKTDLLMVEIIKIISMFNKEEDDLPILISIYNLNSFMQYMRLKIKLRKSSVKVKKAKKKDENGDIVENLEFVQKEFNFPFSIYEEIYDAYYKKGAEVDA
jgi:hypothetical protein